MSDGILFLDMINHYSLKLTEIADSMAEVKSYLNKSLILTEESWSSDSADAFKLKAEEIKMILNRCEMSLDELLKLMNVVKNNEVDARTVEQ